MKEVLVKKDEENELPIPHIWRPIFKRIVDNFAKEDYSMNNPIANVNSVSRETEEQIREYIEGYGEKLVELPEESWETSVYIYSGDYWKVLIDLYTELEGLSDLVLSAEVRQVNDDYKIDISMVYVP